MQHHERTSGTSEARGGEAGEDPPPITLAYDALVAFAIYAGS